MGNISDRGRTENPQKEGYSTGPDQTCSPFRTEHIHSSLAILEKRGFTLRKIMGQLMPLIAGQRGFGYVFVKI